MSATATDIVAQIRDALRLVIDPELGHNIVDLGFIYDIAVDNEDARITMTATTPGCPATGYLKDGAVSSALGVPGIAYVDVVMTFVPPWSPDMISADVKADLGFANVN